MSRSVQLRLLLRFIALVRQTNLEAEYLTFMGDLTFVNNLTLNITGLKSIVF